MPKWPPALAGDTVLQSVELGEWKIFKKIFHNGKYFRSIGLPEVVQVVDQWILNGRDCRTLCKEKNVYTYKGRLWLIFQNNHVLHNKSFSQPCQHSEFLHYNFYFSVRGIKSKKKLDPKKQLCAGHKVRKLRRSFYEYTNNRDARKIKFKAVLFSRVFFKMQFCQDFSGLSCSSRERTVVEGAESW